MPQRTLDGRREAVLSLIRVAIVPFLAVIGAVIVAIVLMWEFSHSAERDWRADYRNQFGEPCCDDSDCGEIRTDVALRLRLGEFAKVGEYVHAPVNAIYPTQDGLSYLCKTGCLFRPLLN